MKPTTGLLTLIVVAAITGACTSGEQKPTSEATPAASPTASPASQGIDITFTSEPDPPKTGANMFEAMVMANGQPVTDADVVVEFYMPAMPAMNMAEMRNSVPLKPEGGGRYRGTGNVMMAGGWETTVRATRGGQEIGSKKFNVTAK